MDEKKCEHNWEIWGVDNTIDKNLMVRCSKCSEIIQERLKEFNGHLPMGIFQGQGGYTWTCSPACPKCNPPTDASIGQSKSDLSRRGDKSKV